MPDLPDALDRMHRYSGTATKIGPTRLKLPSHEGQAETLQVTGQPVLCSRNLRELANRGLPDLERPSFPDSGVLVDCASLATWTAA